MDDPQDLAPADSEKDRNFITALARGLDGTGKPLSCSNRTLSLIAEQRVEGLRAGAFRTGRFAGRYAWELRVAAWQPPEIPIGAGLVAVTVEVTAPGAAAPFSNQRSALLRRPDQQRREGRFRPRHLRRGLLHILGREQLRQGADLRRAAGAQERRRRAQIGDRAGRADDRQLLAREPVERTGARRTARGERQTTAMGQRRSRHLQRRGRPGQVNAQIIARARFQRRR